jgi:hypothetical protein
MATSISVVPQYTGNLKDCLTYYQSLLFYKNSCDTVEKSQSNLAFLRMKFSCGSVTALVEPVPEWITVPEPDLDSDPT